MSSFQDYISSLPSTISSLGPSSKLRLSLGNQSCDLDSMVSAFGHAHYSHCKGGDNFVSIPVLACKRAEFALRPEAVQVLSEAGVQSDCLVFSDDLSEEKILGFDDVQITLLDHNSNSQRLNEKVVQIIDHHELVPDSPASKPEVNSLVERVGSCASHVTEMLLNDTTYSLEPNLSLLLISAILIDTGNLKSEGIVTDKDIKMASKLQEILPSSFDGESQFKSLFTKRFDVSNLTTIQVLGRDFKNPRVCDKYQIGFSSVTANLSDFIARENFQADISEFYESNSLDALLLLGIYVQEGDLGERKRQIFVHLEGRSESDLAESIATMLETNAELACTREEGVACEGVLLNQGNVRCSRKQILPIVTQFISNVEGEQSPEPPLEPIVTIATNAGGNPIPEYSISEEQKEVRTRRYVNLAGEEHVINMTLVEPYSKIVQHAGYVGDDRKAVMVICAHHLPSRGLPNYKQVAEELFYYIMSVLDRIIVDQYIVVYLHSGAPRNSRPPLQLLNRLYQLVDRRFRKQLTQLYIVHPTFFIKSILTLARPFISTKFWRKVHYVPALGDLPSHLTIDESLIPVAVKDADSAITRNRAPPMRYTPSSTDN